jgi:transposase-like protein
VGRGGKVIAGHVDTRKKKDLKPMIREFVEAGSSIFTDALKSYDGLSSEFEHAVFAAFTVLTSAWNRFICSVISMNRRFVMTIGSL